MLQLFRSKYQLIFNYTIYGERHSGTNFLERCISSKFDLDLTYFFGFKHFFGWSKPEFLTYRGKHTLFIGITRNPYDWILAFQKAPSHVPKINRNFPNFLINEWYSVDNNREMLEDRNFLNEQRYKNIFELRKIKCLYLTQELPKILDNYVLLSYDQLRHDHINIFNIIGERFNLKTVGNVPSFISKNETTLTDEIKEIIDTNIDWDVEASLGYYKK